MTERTCPKCGSADIYTRLHMGRSDCGYRYHSTDVQKDGEHLHDVCRGCGYQTTRPPLDSGKAAA